MDFRIGASTLIDALRKDESSANRGVVTVSRQAFAIETNCEDVLELMKT